MAELGIEATSVAPIQNNVTPVEGVGQTNPLIDTASQLVGQIGDVFTERKVKLNDQMVADFTNRQTMVVDALAQNGRINPAQARTMMRRNFLDAINANPSLRKELASAHSTVLSLFGEDINTSQGRLEEERTNRRNDWLVSNGLADASASEAEFEAADRAAQIATAAEQRYQEQMRTLNMQQAAGQVSAQQREAIEQQRTAETRSFLRDATPNQVNSLRTEFNGILLDNSISEAEKTQRIQDRMITWRAEVANFVVDFDSQEYAAYLKPFEMIEETYLQRVTGELNDQEVERRISRASRVQESLMMADPDLSRLAVASKLFDSTVIQEALTTGRRGDIVKGLIKFLADGDPDTNSANPSHFYDTNADKEAGRAYLDSLLQGINDADTEVRDEAGRRVTSFVESIEDYQGQIRRNPEKAIALVNWMSNPEFLSAINANPELFQDIGGAGEVITEHYANEVWGMVQNEFRNNNVLVGDPNANPRVRDRTNAGAEQVPSSSLVQALPDANGMRFAPVEGAGPEARREAARLNKELAPIINTTVKAISHLEGNSNYQQTWDKVGQDFLGGGFGQGDDELAGGDAGDDLSIESFRKKESPLDDPELLTGGLVGNGDYSNAETPAEVAAAFVGFREDEHKNVLSSFIKQTMGTNLNPEDTAWCAAFVNAALGATGQEGTGKLNARSFLNWGTPVTEPAQGDVVVFKRGNSSWQGHVGFYMGKDENGNIKVLGGNQSDSVSVQSYRSADLLGYRRG